MELLLTRLKLFPAGTLGRIYSQDIKVEAQSNARSTFPELAARGAFKAYSAPWAEVSQDGISSHFTSARQEDCKTVKLYDDAANEIDYQISEGTLTSVEMSQIELGTIIRVTILSPRSLELRFSYPTFDPCSNQSRATVDTAQVLTWRRPEEDQRDQVSVTAGMLQLLESSAVTVPADLPPLQGRTATDSVTVPFSGLEQLMSGGLTPGILVCPVTPAGG